MSERIYYHPQTDHPEFGRTRVQHSQYVIDPVWFDHSTCTLYWHSLLCFPLLVIFSTPESRYTIGTNQARRVVKED